MPAAIVLAAASTIGSVAAAGGLAAFSFFGVSGLTGALLAAATNIAFSSLSGMMSKKPKSSVADFAQQSTGRTQQIRQPITTHKIILGEVLVSGAMTFWSSTDNKRFHHYVITLARHEVEAIDEIWVNDEVVPVNALDAEGNVTSGRYAGKLRLRKHLGTDGQLADERMVAEIPEWTNQHRGRGVAYIYVRVDFNRETYPTGLPNIAAVVRGKRVFDPRINATAWTPNVALLSRYYLSDTTYGMEAATEDINDTLAASQANICDEIVNTKTADFEVTAVNGDVLTLKGDMLEMMRGCRVRLLTAGVAPGGISTDTDYYVVPVQYGKVPRMSFATSLDNALKGIALDLTDAGTGIHTVRKTGEPRYYGGGLLDTAQTLGDNLRDVLSGMGGNIINVGGYWEFYAAAYRAPELTFNESHFRKPPEIDPRRSRKEKFNSVKGVYIAPGTFWQPTDFPEVAVSAYIAADRGRKITTDLDLPITQSAATAQRIARIKIELIRREMRAYFPLNLHGIPAKSADTIRVNNEELGFENKVFEVITHQLVEDVGKGGKPVVGVDMNIQETDANVYAWDTDFEADPRPAVRTTLSSPFVVSAPTGLNINSIPVNTLADDRIYNVVLGWNQHPDAFVRELGWFQIRYKKSAEPDSAFKPVSGRIEGYEVQADVFTGQLGTLYDLEMIAFNRLGVPSSPQRLNNFIVGTAGGVSETLDYGTFSGGDEIPADTLDYGTFSGGDEIPTTTLDYGGFTA